MSSRNAQKQVSKTVLLNRNHDLVTVCAALANVVMGVDAVLKNRWNWVFFWRGLGKIRAGIRKAVELIEKGAGKGDG